MKRLIRRSALVLSFAAMIFGSVLAVLRPVHGQASQNVVITLDDSSPGASVLVTLDNNAPGAVYIELNNAQLTLTDASNANILTISDKRVKAFSFQLKQGAPTHILHFTRSTGAATAQIYLQPQATIPEIISPASSARTVADALSIGNPASVHLAPANSVPVTVSDPVNMLDIQFPEKPVTMQLMDSTGVLLLTKFANGTMIGGLTVSLSQGPYVLNATNSDVAVQSDLELALLASPISQLAMLVPTETPTAIPCVVKVIMPSVNFRSGPGTGYSILGVGFKNDILPAGGVNTQGGWLLLQTKYGAAWVSSQTVNSSGPCSNLSAFNIPIMNAVVAAPATVVPIPAYVPPAVNNPPPAANQQPVINGGGEHDGGGD